MCYQFFWSKEDKHEVKESFNVPPEWSFMITVYFSWRGRVKI